MGYRWRSVYKGFYVIQYHTDSTMLAIISFDIGLL